MKRPATRGDKLLRGALLLTGLAILFWSGLEDRDANAVTLLGALSSISLTLWLLSRMAAGHALKPMYFGLSGALTGALAALCTAALMLFKNLRHAHVFPDYPPEMLLAALARLPLWADRGRAGGAGHRPLAGVLVEQSRPGEQVTRQSRLVLPRQPISVPSVSSVVN